MARRIGAKGQVLIPKELRDQAGLGPGTEVEFEAIEEGIVVRRAGRPSALRGRFVKSGMTGRLLEDRRNEAR